LQPNLTQVIFLCVLILVSLWKFFRSSIIFFYGYFFRFLLFLVILNFFFVLHVRFSWVSSLLPSSCPFPSIFSYLFRFICPSPLIVFLFIFFFQFQFIVLFSFSFSAVYCFVFVHVVSLIIVWEYWCYKSCCFFDSKSSFRKFFRLLCVIAVSLYEQRSPVLNFCRERV
jgi:hypothetical protein